MGWNCSRCEQLGRAERPARRSNAFVTPLAVRAARSARAECSQREHCHHNIPFDKPRLARYNTLHV